MTDSLKKGGTNYWPPKIPRPKRTQTKGVSPSANIAIKVLKTELKLARMRLAAVQEIIRASDERDEGNIPGGRIDYALDLCLISEAVNQPVTHLPEIIERAAGNPEVLNDET